MLKFYRPEDPFYYGSALPLNENTWFEVNQPLLLAMANTKAGRDLLCIPQEYPKIVDFRKNRVVSYLGKWNGRDHFKGDFRIGAKWANVIRYRWHQFVAMSRYFIVNHPEVESPLLRYSLSIVASTLTAYPQPSVAASYGDGRTYRTTGGESWSTIRNGAGNGTDDADDRHTADINANTSSNLFDTVTIGVFAFDTSVTSGQVIDSSTFSFVANNSSNGLGGLSLSCVQGVMASNTAPSNSDYENTTSSSGTLFATDIPISSVDISDTVYTDFAHNASGKAAISATITKMALCSSATSSGTSPTWSSGGQSWVVIWFAEHTGTSLDPKLVVNYSAPPPAPKNSMLLLGV